MPRYLTVESVKAYARNELPTDDDAFIESAADAAEMLLDRDCGRKFVVVGATATARLFVPESPSLVRIHDCTEITAVTSSGATVGSSSYQLEPVNGLTSFGETVPYDRIRLLSGSWGLGSSTRFEATVSVTAKWGWAAIPARIEQAALTIAKEILVNRDEVKMGLVGFSDVGGVVARTNPMVRATIEHYRRFEALGLA